MNTRAADGGIRPIIREGGIPPRKFAGAVALSAGAVLAGAALLGTSGYLISKAALQPPILTLTVAIVGVRAFGVARALLRYGERVVTHDIALGSLARLRARFFARLVPLVPGGVASGAADLLAGFVADVEALRDLYVRVLVPPFAAVVAALAVVGVAVWLLPAAGLALAAGLLIAGTFAPWFAGRIAQHAGRRQAPERARLTRKLVDAIDGAQELAAGGAEKSQAEIVDAASDRLSSVQRRDAFAAGAATALASLIAGLTILAVLVLAANGANAGRLPGVAIAVLLFLALASFEAVTPLSAAAQSAEHCRAAAKRLNAVLGRAPAVEEPAAPKQLPATGNLALRNVSFDYPNGGRGLLEGATLEIAQGERVALVGPSGCGKSTIAHLMVRFIDPRSGCVRIGDTDLRELPLDEIRSAVRLESQQGYLFTTSIRDNVRLASPDADDAEIARVLAASGLGEWLGRLPDGLDTVVGEQGAHVSGGQRQRIAFARGLLARSRFLILDEPTAHLDRDSATAMLDAILEGTPADTGVLVITHNVEGLDRFDRVLQLAGGSVVPTVTSNRVMIQNAQ